MIKSIERDHLRADLVTEQYTYYIPSPVEMIPMQLTVASAASTVGGNIVEEGVFDLTGIMIWPATHLLCQHLIAGDIICQDSVVLELGCGCGLVGMAALKAKCPPSLWVSTDMDEQVLSLCRQNFSLNNLVANNIKSLKWGDQDRIQELLADLRLHLNVEDAKFDSIMAADIVYPATSGNVIELLLTTVDCLLKDGGVFWLSFAARDGAQTPVKLLHAASKAGFRITALDPLSPDVAKRLPPLLGSTILILERNPDAELHNLNLGGDDCTVFPGLGAAIARQEELSSDEEWEPPFSDDDV
jgi:predicted nicotinamide N-methyase